MAEAVVDKALSVTDSIFAVLFIGACIGAVFLTRYVLKKNDEREVRYIAVIEQQAIGLQKIDDLKRDVADIKTTIMARGGG